MLRLSCKCRSISRAGHVSCWSWSCMFCASTTWPRVYSKLIWAVMLSCLDWTVLHYLMPFLQVFLPQYCRLCLQCRSSGGAQSQAMWLRFGCKSQQELTINCLLVHKTFLCFMHQDVVSNNCDLLGIVIGQPSCLQPTLYSAVCGCERHCYIRRAASSCRMKPSVRHLLLLLLLQFFCLLR